ncbi:MAG: hypothetical protein ACLT38_10775 [Akkermansia sp.]
MHSGSRQLTHDAGLTVDDIAKRLMDYGFHGPTMSFPFRAPDGGASESGKRTGPLH